MADRKSDDASSDVVAAVEGYLQQTEGRFPKASDEYFARLALQSALTSFRTGNYGIGAVAIVRTSNTIREFEGGNRMVTGLGLTDHAETRALLRVANGEQPDRAYALDEDFRPVLESDGLAVFGTLEPCPMCSSVMTNAGVARSVSTVLDGKLVKEGDFLTSGGAATVLDGKSNAQPRVWRNIQHERGLKFELLSTDDGMLKTLSERIFLQTRKEIDAQLGKKPPVGTVKSRQLFYRSLVRPSTVSMATDTTDED